MTIDYLKGTTVESFSSAYEYSFTGSDWKTCSGTPIAFTPGTVNQYLWVRQKGTDSAPAGNITKVVIPAMSRITGDITMIYKDDGYLVSGLSAGTYWYAFTNDKTGVTLEKSITVKDGELIKILEEKADWSFIALGTAATETSFASQIRYVVAERPWVIDTDTYVITGIKGETDALQVVNYYGAKGYVVTVVNPDGSTTEAVGTGYTINLDGQSHKAVVTGDVNGDAKIDLDDLALILDYMNSEKELTGIYFDAGFVHDDKDQEFDEDIDLFDLWAELAYHKTGSFEE